VTKQQRALVLKELMDAGKLVIMGSGSSLLEKTIRKEAKNEPRTVVKTDRRRTSDQSG